MKPSDVTIFAGGVGMHVHGLNSHERAEALRTLDNRLRDEPGVDQAVIRIDKRALTPGFLAPARYLHNTLQISVGLSTT
jgi:hypothetical protein